MVVNQVLLLLLKPQPYVPAKTFATNCSFKEEAVLARVVRSPPTLSSQSIIKQTDARIWDYPMPALMAADVPCCWSFCRCCQIFCMCCVAQGNLLCQVVGFFIAYNAYVRFDFDE